MVFVSIKEGIMRTFKNIIKWIVIIGILFIIVKTIYGIGYENGFNEAIQPTYDTN